MSEEQLEQKNVGDLPFDEPITFELLSAMGAEFDGSERLVMNYGEGCVAEFDLHWTWQRAWRVK